MVPTSTAVDIVSRAAVPANSQAVVVFVAEGADASAVGSALGETERTALRMLISSKVARGKAREAVVDVVEIGGGKFRRLIVAGLGKPDKITGESFRQAGGAALKALRKQ